MFSLHTDIVAKQSKALDVLINGAMSEASVGSVILDDVHEDTFERFCQFAYTGNYTTPEYECVAVSPSIISEDSGELEARRAAGSATLTDAVVEAVVEAMETVEAVEVEPERPSTSKNKKLKKPSKARLLRQSLDDQRFNTDKIQNEYNSPCEVRSNSRVEEDYTPVFLGHAQLYVFAEKWGITSLKTLTLSKLHKTLATFTLYARRRTDIVELLRFAYSNEHTPDRLDEVDELRSLIMLYVGTEIENMIHCSGFSDFIEEGGEFALDLVQIMMKRI